MTFPLLGVDDLGAEVLGGCGSSSPMEARYGSMASSMDPCFVRSSIALSSVRFENIEANCLAVALSTFFGPWCDVDVGAVLLELRLPEAHFLSTYFAWINFLISLSEESASTASSMPSHPPQSSSFSLRLPPLQMLSASFSDQFVIEIPLTVSPASRRRPEQREQTKLK